MKYLLILLVGVGGLANAELIPLQQNQNFDYSCSMEKVDSDQCQIESHYDPTEVLRMAEEMRNYRETKFVMQNSSEPDGLFAGACFFLLLGLLIL